MLLCVTIDTEEDNWGDFNTDTYQCTNIQKIPELQRVFDKYNIIPTYLISYPVANDPISANILKDIAQKRRCEIGMHCHPWNTPPVEEKRNKCNSMLCNLPKELVYKKMSFLHETIKKNFGLIASSFRAGRWGYGDSVAAALNQLNYQVDSSVFPMTDWSKDYGPDFSNIGPTPYRFHSTSIYENNKNGKMTEIPATVGFLHQNISLCVKIDKFLNHHFLRKIKMRGILRKLRIFKKIYLSPETSSFQDMIKISNYFLKKDVGILNLFFHSTSLKKGLSPFVRSEKQEIIFLKNLEKYFQYTKSIGARSAGLSQASMLLFKYV